MGTRKGRVPTPLEVEQQVRRIKASLEQLTEGKYSYREAHTHVRSDRRDPVKGDENQGVRISNSHVSDPTAEIVESQEWNRERLAQAHNLLSAAEDAVGAALTKTRDVFSHRDDYYRPLASYRP